MASFGYKQENVKVPVNEELMVELMVVVDLWVIMLVLTVIEPFRF